MKCRHCGHAVTLPFIDLGTAPPSNAYLTQTELSEPEKWYPLRLFACTHCWLVQTEEHSSRSELFSGDYAYFSSYSTSWLQHAETYVAEMVDRFALGPNAHVVEIAANDGYLLQYVKARGIPCLGVEPTAGTAAAARLKGIAVVEQFFGASLADRLAREGKAADLMVANNVLAHVPDINDFVSGFARLLKPQGCATFEFPHLLRLAEHCQFDTIYHEHYSYLSLTAVKTIFEAHGLDVFDVRELDTHGGSLRVFAQRRGEGARSATATVAALLASEEMAGVGTEAFYCGFEPRANAIKYDVIEFLIDARRRGKKVAAYGAAAKGNTLLNYAGIRSDLLPWVVDRNPAKQGKFLPGSRIPIVDETRIKKERPDYILILPWNLRAEVVEQLAYAREWGAQFVTAVPRLHLQ